MYMGLRNFKSLKLEVADAWMVEITSSHQISTSGARSRNTRFTSRYEMRDLYCLECDVQQMFIYLIQWRDVKEREENMWLVLVDEWASWLRRRLQRASAECWKLRMRMRWCLKRTLAEMKSRSHDETKWIDKTKRVYGAFYRYLIPNIWFYKYTMRRSEVQFHSIPTWLNCLSPTTLFIPHKVIPEIPYPPPSARYHASYNVPSLPRQRKYKCGQWPRQETPRIPLEQTIQIDDNKSSLNRSN